MILKHDEKLFVFEHFLAPRIAVESLQSFELVSWKIGAFPFHIFVARHPADRSFFSQRAAVRPVHNPFQHTHVFAESWPQEMSFFVLAEPVDVENLWRDAKRALHL